MNAPVNFGWWKGYVIEVGDSLAKMIDALDQVGNPIITCCMGKAMSCGAILPSHGRYRYCAPNSRVMVHEVSSMTGGDVHDMFNDASESKRLNAHFMHILAKNCGIKKGFAGLRKIIKDHDGRELWMDAKKALAFGIVDEVGTPQIVPYIAYDIVTIQPPPRSQRVKRIKDILGVQ